MEIELIKKELIGRYRYLYENSMYILAPFVQRIDEKSKKKSRSFEKAYIEIGQLPDKLLLNLESFLLSDIPYSMSVLYTDLERNKQEHIFYDEVKNGLQLMKEGNDAIFNPYHRVKIDIWVLLSKVRIFIESLPYSDDIDKKLAALDEYFRIARYKNDGVVWHSGYEVEFIDYKNEKGFETCFASKEKLLDLNPEEIGLKAGEFVNFISNQANHYKNNSSVLLEEDKQIIYLSYHDELPWNKKIRCEKSPSKIGVENPCGSIFYIKENDIFVNPSEQTNRYYQMCPCCGYLVSISSNILPNSVKKRVEERCIKDPELFEKMGLYSRLYNLEQSSTEEAKRLFRSYNMH